MTMYHAHEHVIVCNGGTRSERIHYTGDDECFSSREDAQASADCLNAAYDLGLVVYLADPD